MPDRQFKISAEKPHVSEVAPHYILAGFLLVLSIPFTVMLPITGFPFWFGALMVYLFSLTRTKAHSEVIQIVDDELQVYRAGNLRWRKSLVDIQTVDIDTFSEYVAIKGQTMVVFYLTNGESWSTSYVNFTMAQLQNLKRYISGTKLENL